MLKIKTKKKKQNFKQFIDLVKREMCKKRTLKPEMRAEQFNR